MTEKPTRIEKDSMGEMSLPANALHGASTHRAVLNFPVSGYRFSRPFIRALGLIKWAAAQANHDLGLLDAERAALIVQAAEEVADGKLDDHFPLDIFQTGSGTSTNTNANEVIANRCAQLAGKTIGSRELVPITNCDAAVKAAVLKYLATVRPSNWLGSLILLGR